MNIDTSLLSSPVSLVKTDTMAEAAGSNYTMWTLTAAYTLVSALLTVVLTEVIDQRLKECQSRKQEKAISGRRVKPVHNRLLPLMIGLVATNTLILMGIAGCAVATSFYLSNNTPENYDPFFNLMSGATTGCAIGAGVWYLLNKKTPKKLVSHKPVNSMA